MHIQFLDSVAGERFAYRKGQKVDLRIDLAKDFIRDGLAVAIAPPVAEPLPGIRRGRRGGASAEIAITGATETR